MAKRETPRIVKSVNASDIDMEIRNGKANIGIVAHSGDSSFLVITNSRNEVVDIHNIENGLDGIKLDKSTIILDSTSSSDYTLQSGYYTPRVIENNYTVQKFNVTRDGADATQDMFYDKEIGRTGGVELTAAERQMVYDKALSLLHSPTTMSSEDLASYLNRATNMYSGYQRAHRTNSEIEFGDIQSEQIRRIESEWGAITSGSDPQGFSHKLRFLSNEINAEHLSTLSQEQYGQSQNGYFNQLDRAKALHDLQLTTMSAEYNDTVQQMLIKYPDLLSKDGLTMDLGSNSAASLEKIQNAIKANKTQLDEYVASGEDASTIRRNQEYLRELTKVEQFHPAIMNDITVQSNDRYHFMVDQNIYASTHDNIGGHGRNANESYEHAFVLYKGDMSQREYYEYITDKAKIIEALALNDELGSRKNAYYTLYHENSALTQQQKLQNVSDMLCTKLSISDSSRVHDFLHSHEFQTIMENRSTLYATKQDAKGNLEYITWVGDDKFKTSPTSPESNPTVNNLAPAYSILLKNDLSTKEGCANLQHEIEVAIKREELLHARPSQELLTMQRFINEYVSYNELTHVANREQTFANGLSHERVEYSDFTLAALNDVGYKRTSQALTYLEEHGYHTDFKSIPTFEKLHSNYDAITTGLNDIAQSSTKDLRSVVQNTSGIKGDVSPNAAQSLIKDIPTINSLDNEARALQIIKSMGLECDKLSQKDVEAINRSYEKAQVSLNEVHQFTHKSGMSELCTGLKQDISHEVQLTRGCDHLYGRTITGAFEQKSADAKMLDFATAVSGSENAKKASLQVVENHEVRNKMIDMLEQSLSTKEDKSEMYKRMRQFATDAEAAKKDGKDITQDPDKILSTIGIKFADEKEQKIARELIMSNDFQKEFNNMVSVATSSQPLSSPYYLAMQKTGGLDEYKKIIAQSESLAHGVDYSMLGSRGYLEVLKTQNPQNAALTTSVDKIITENKYVEVLVTTRNLEDVIHRTNSTQEEIATARRIAEDIAYINASEDTNTMKYRIAQYDQLIRAAADPTKQSEYMKSKIDDATSTIETEAQKLQQSIDKIFKTQAQNGIISLSKNEDYIGSSAILIKRAIESDQGFYELRDKVEHAIKTNANYGEMVEHNQISYKQAQIAAIDKKIEHLELRLLCAEGYKEQHSQASFVHKATDRIKSGFGPNAVQRDDLAIQDLHEKIKSLEEKKNKLIEEMQVTREHTEHSITSFEQYKSVPSLNNAKDAIKDALSIHGTDTLDRTKSTREESIDTYSSKELLVATQNLKIPACVEDTFHQARKTIADNMINESIASLNEMRISRVGEIQATVAPLAKDTEITPTFIREVLAKGEIGQEDKRSLLAYANDLEMLQKPTTEENFMMQAGVLTKTESSKVISLKNDFVIASEARELSVAKLETIYNIDHCRDAYHHLENLRVACESLSQNERQVAADKTFKNEVTLTKESVIDILNKNGQSDFATALNNVYKHQNDIDKITEMLQKGKVDKFTETEIRALQVISEYNKALGSISDTEKANLAGVIVKEQAQFTSAENIRKTQDFVFKPIEANGLNEAIESNERRMAVLNDAVYVRRYEELSPAVRFEYVAKYFKHNMQAANSVDFSNVNAAKVEDVKTTTAIAAITMSEYSQNEISTGLRLSSNHELRDMVIPFNDKSRELILSQVSSPAAGVCHSPALFTTEEAKSIVNTCNRLGEGKDAQLQPDIANAEKIIREREEIDRGSTVEQMVGGIA